MEYIKTYLNKLCGQYDKSYYIIFRDNTNGFVIALEIENRRFSDLLRYDSITQAVFLFEKNIQFVYSKSNQFEKLLFKQELEKILGVQIYNVV